MGFLDGFLVISRVRKVEGERECGRLFLARVGEDNEVEKKLA